MLDVVRGALGAGVPSAAGLPRQPRHGRSAGICCLGTSHTRYAGEPAVYVLRPLRREQPAAGVQARPPVRRAQCQRAAGTKACGERLAPLASQG